MDGPRSPARVSVTRVTAVTRFIGVTCVTATGKPKPPAGQGAGLVNEEGGSKGADMPSV